MFNSDLTANRPAAGIVGRIFIAIDSPYGIFRDTGTAWDQISSVGGGATIYTGDGTLTGTRTISSGGFELVFNPQTTFFSSLTASTGASSFSVLGSNALTFAAGFSSSNIGNVYGANGAINAQNFLGNATFAQANLASAMVNVNKIDFGSGGHTITMTQSTGIRAMTGVQNQIQFTGSHNGTISHAAISQNLGFFRDAASTRTLTITNAYSLLINALDDYGAGFTFTNRWGIYQAGASDKNYFAANSLFGTTVNAGYRVDISGTARITSTSFATTLLIDGSAPSISFTSSNGLYIYHTNSGFMFTVNSGTTAFSGLIMGAGNTTAQSVAFGGIAIGGYHIARASHTTALAVGKETRATSNMTTSLGVHAVCNNSSSCAIHGGYTTASNQLVIGGVLSLSGFDANITDVFFGSGVNNGYWDGTSAGNITGNGLSYSINGSGAFGTDFSGGNVTIAGGKGTGSGTSGDVIISTATPTTSGTTLQTLTSRWWVKGSSGTLSNVSSPDASAILQINSTTQGFRPPVMTNAQRIAIASPAIGLIVYCTDAVEGLYINKSTGWTFVI
jgi:hypothetical protein